MPSLGACCLTPDPSRVRMSEARIEARREVRIAGETAADKVGDTVGRYRGDAVRR